MNNLLPRSVKMHMKYDLKGSTYKRRASQKEREKPLPTFKDLDFIQDIPDGLFLDADMYNALCKTLQRDCLVSLSYSLSRETRDLRPGSKLYFLSSFSHQIWDKVGQKGEISRLHCTLHAGAWVQLLSPHDSLSAEPGKAYKQKIARR